MKVLVYAYHVCINKRIADVCNFMQWGLTQLDFKDDDGHAINWVIK